MAGLRGNRVYRRRNSFPSAWREQKIPARHVSQSAKDNRMIFPSGDELWDIPSRVVQTLRALLLVLKNANNLHHSQILSVAGYFSFCQLVRLNNVLLLGSNVAVDALGVLNPEL